MIFVPARHIVDNGKAGRFLKRESIAQAKEPGGGIEQAGAGFIAFIIIIVSGLPLLRYKPGGTFFNPHFAGNVRTVQDSS